MKKYLDFINKNVLVSYYNATVMINQYIPDEEVYSGLDILTNYEKEFQKDFRCSVSEYREVVDWVAKNIKNIKVKHGPKSSEITLNGINNSTIPKYIHHYSEFDVCKQMTINNCQGLTVIGSFCLINKLEKIIINDSNVILTELEFENAKLIEFHGSNSTIKFPESMHAFVNINTVICNNCVLLDIENVCTDLKKVTSMYLINCGLSEIPNFQNMNVMYILDLSKNNITKIGDSTGADRVNKLICKNNKIDTITDNITEFKKLKRLILDDNLLSELPDIINKIKLLLVISLDNNKFQKTPDNISNKRSTGLSVSLVGNNIDKNDQLANIPTTKNKQNIRFLY